MRVPVEIRIQLRYRSAVTFIVSNLKTRGDSKVADERFVVLSAGRSRMFEKVRLPDGTSAFGVDAAVHRRALRRADAKLRDVLDAIRETASRIENDATDAKRPAA